jgi:hypothetical protein
MRYTPRDLEIVRWQVLTLQRFISEHRSLVRQAPWEPTMKAAAEQLLVGFEATLEEKKKHYKEIWTELHPANSGGNTMGRRQRVA